MSLPQILPPSMEETSKGLYVCSTVGSTKCCGGGELEDDPVPTLLFTAGTALAALCLKRALLAFLGKQCWQVWWVFVLLNVILLVVFFTSMRSSATSCHRSQESEPKDDGEQTPKKQRKRRLRRCSGSAAAAAVERAPGGEREESVYGEQDGWNGTEEREDDEAGVYEGLSDEELNERVETFIATFRRHLASDARRR